MSLELSTRTLGDWLEHWAEVTPDKEYIVHTFVELAPSEAEVTVRVDNVFFIRSYLGPVFEPVAEGSC